jgi:L-serine dehydratase
MALSVFDMFTIGIGPSSSHTVGPMRAALRFAGQLAGEGTLPRTAAVRWELFGSLGATGYGHGSDRAVMLGLTGERPETVDPDAVPGIVAAIRARPHRPGR